MFAYRLVFALWCALSLVACSPAMDWREFHFEDGGFTILFPQKPGRAERKLATPAGEVTMKMVSVRVDETVFGAASADFPAPPDTAAQAAMRGALLKNLEGTVISDKEVNLGAGRAAWTGREVVKRGTVGKGERAEDAQLRARFFVRDQRYYQIAVMGRAGAVQEADLDMFFTSFKPD
jgi:hypothetical protein